MDPSLASGLPSSRPAARRVPWIALLLVVLAAISTVVGWQVWEATSGRPLRSLPAAERLEIYTRTMDDLATLCGSQRPEALRDHCRELAELVAPLPECTAECEALIRPILTPAPTR